MEAGDAPRVRLELLDSRGVDTSQARHAVGPAAPLELLEPRELSAIGGDDHLPAALAGDLVLLAVLVHLAGALHAQARLQRARRVIDARVDHARVVAGLVGSDLVLALEHANRGQRVASGQRSRDGQPDDPPAHDRQVTALGRVRIPWAGA